MNIENKIVFIITTTTDIARIFQTTEIIYINVTNSFQLHRYKNWCLDNRLYIHNVNFLHNKLNK